jgi:hypothetical protein
MIYVQSLFGLDYLVFKGGFDETASKKPPAEERSIARKNILARTQRSRKAACMSKEVGQPCFTYREESIFPLPMRIVCRNGAKKKTAGFSDSAAIRTAMDTITNLKLWSGDL